MKLKRSNFMRVVVCVAIAISVVACAALGYQIHRARLSESILDKIDQLVLHPPDDVPELEWAVLVYWTHNLHCNSIPQVYASYPTLRELDQYLDATIAEGPTRESIDELWERYASISDSGLRYRMKYMPVRDSIADTVAAEGEDFFDARSYQDFVTYVQSSNRN
jgi:hypothetical protein